MACAGLCSGNTTLRVSSAEQLAVMAPILPSPDWFIGLHGFALCQRGRWIDWARVPLLPYDQGTHEGTTFAYSFNRSQPQQAVSRLWTQEGNLFEDPSMCVLSGMPLHSGQWDSCSTQRRACRRHLQNTMSYYRACTGAAVQCANVRCSAIVQAGAGPLLV